MASDALNNAGKILVILWDTDFMVSGENPQDSCRAFPLTGRPRNNIYCVLPKIMYKPF
jgi:hypothetical protein